MCDPVPYPLRAHLCDHLSGWSNDKAEEVFDEVNTDGEGGVGIEEFENWWITTQRDQQVITTIVKR